MTNDSNHVSDNSKNTILCTSRKGMCFKNLSVFFLKINQKKKKISLSSVYRVHCNIVPTCPGIHLHNSNIFRE